MNEKKKFDHVVGFGMAKLESGQEFTFSGRTKLAFRPQRLFVRCDDPRTLQVKSVSTGASDIKRILFSGDHQTAERFCVDGGGKLDDATSLVQEGAFISVVVKSYNGSNLLQTVACAVLGETEDDESGPPDGSPGKGPMTDDSSPSMPEERPYSESSLFAKAIRWFDVGFKRAVEDCAQVVTLRSDKSPLYEPVEQLKLLIVDLIFFLQAPLKLAINALGNCDLSSPSGYVPQEMRTVLGLRLVADEAGALDGDKILPGMRASLIAIPQMRFRGETLRLFGDLTDLVVTDIKVGSNSQLPTSDPVESRAFETNHPMSLDDCPIWLTVRVSLLNRGKVSASVSGVMAGVNLGCD